VDVRRFSSSVEPPAPDAVARLGRSDDPVTGILLVLGAMLLFSCSDATAKFLTESLSALEIAWIRYTTFTLLVLPAMLRAGSASLRARRPSVQIARGLCLLASSLLFILGVSYLPMADATATSFVSPLLTTALAIPFLGEKVGIRRWAAVAIGLAGVLIVVRPGSSAFNPASVLPLLSAASWAMAMVITRKYSNVDAIVTMLAYAAVTGFVVLTLAQPLVWRTPSLLELGLGVFIGFASSAGQWLVVRAYRRASASVLAPFSYTQLVWSTMLGFAVFGAIPDGQTLLGASIIVASGLYTLHRERVTARKAR
jgi:drug/metabolite transporter (DMT)-like permease